jgi:hypothetical protein
VDDPQIGGGEEDRDGQRIERRFEGRGHDAFDVE